MIITPQDRPFRWAAFRQADWPVEVWLLTPDSYLADFADCATKRWPLLPEMCRDGIVLRDRERLAQQIKAEASEIIKRGPEPLSEAEMNQYRFDLTSMLDDLEASSDPTEVLLVAGGVFHVTATIWLALHRRWLGQGKWLVRSLRELDPRQARDLIQALETLCRTGEKSQIMQISDSVLDRVGGRLYEGQSRGTWWRRWEGE